VSADPFIYATRRYADKRGEIYFISPTLILSKSFKNVARGLHYQPGVHKTVRCIYGFIIDFAVDIRPESKTLGKCKRFYLGSADAELQVPDGFAHGYFSEAESMVLYELSEPWEQSLEKRIHFNSVMDIDSYKPIMSVADMSAPTFKECFGQESQRYRTL